MAAACESAPSWPPVAAHSALWPRLCPGGRWGPGEPAGRRRARERSSAWPPSWDGARIAADTRRQEDPMKTYAIARLDEIDALPDGRYRYRPVRHYFGIRGFGVTAWVGAAAGDPIINEYDEDS